MADDLPSSGPSNPTIDVPTLVLAQAVVTSYIKPVLAEFTTARPDASPVETAAASALANRMAACLVLFTKLAGKQCAVTQLLEPAARVELEVCDGFRFDLRDGASVQTGIAPTDIPPIVEALLHTGQYL